MEISLKDMLKEALEQNESKDSRYKISKDAELALRRFVEEAQTGVCLGCKGQLVKTEFPSPAIVHVTEANSKSCTYSGVGGMVPDWAFFDEDLFDDS